MKPAVLLLLGFFVAIPFNLPAQSDMIIKQRAKDLRNANDARENANRAANAAPPAAPAPASPAPAAPVTPPVTTQVDAELKENLNKLNSDLGAIKGGSNVASELKDALKTDLSTLAKGSVRPSQETLAKLADDLASALSGTGVDLRESSQLAQAVNVVVNSSMVSAAQAQTFANTAVSALKTSHVPDSAIQNVTGDLKAIMDEVQKKKPKLYQ